MAYAMPSAGTRMSTYTTTRSTTKAPRGRRIPLPAFHCLLTTLCLILLFALPEMALADLCPCGYLINEALYTHAILTSFDKVGDAYSLIDANPRALIDWQVSNWTTNATTKTSTTEALLPKENIVNNVWVEEGMLHLKQDGYDSAVGGSVKVSEIKTRRSDILYGSFRARFRVRETPGSSGGSCVGFFFFDTDVAEIDIEILTKETTNSKIHYSQQPTYNFTTDVFNQRSSKTVAMDLPWSEMQEHRFDWIPYEPTIFYQEKAPVAKVSVNTPETPGTIMLNIWADGGQWSGPPSSADTFMDIAYIYLYFNTSDSHYGEDVGWIKQCEKAKSTAENGGVCVVEGKREINVPGAASGRRWEGAGRWGFVSAVVVVVLGWAVFAGGGI